MNIKFLPYLLIPVFISLLFSFMTKHSITKEKNMSKEHFRIELPKTYTALGFVFLLVGVGLVMVPFIPLIAKDLYEGGGVLLILYFLVTLFFLIAGVILILAVNREMLIIDNTSIVHFPIIGKKQSFTFDDICYIQYSKISNSIDVVQLYGEKDNLLYETTSNCSGYRLLIERLEFEQIATK